MEEPTGRAGAAEEIGEEPRRPPWQAPGRLRTAATLVAGAVAGGTVVWLALGGPSRDVGASAPGGDQGRAASAHPQLAAEQICTHLLADRTVEVTFTVGNVGSVPVRVVAVRPELPLGMLGVLGVDYTPGHCGTGDSGAPDGPLAPQHGFPVTFRLAPLAPCPQPAPVQAAVDIAGQPEVATLSVPLLADLSSVPFPGCG